MARPLTGARLRSPKQPQPTSGLLLRSSISAQVATTNSSAAPSRTALAGPPRPIRPEVRISPTPRTSSVAYTATAIGRRRYTGNSAVGPSAAVSDRDRTTWDSLAAKPPSSRADRTGIWISRRTAGSIASAADRDRRVEAALLQLAAQGDEAGLAQVRDPAARRRAAGRAPVAEQPGDRRAAGHREQAAAARAVVPDLEDAAHRQVRQPGRARAARAGPWALAAAGLRVQCRVGHAGRLVGRL